MKTALTAKSEVTKSSAPIVDSLATALHILDLFTTSEPELSLRQLSEKSGLYKSRIHRLCGTLVASGFLVRMPWSSYRLGPKLMTLGKIYENTNTVVTISRPIMRDLAQTTGESIALFRLNGAFAFCLAREFGSSRLVFAIQEGDNMHLHASAAGRILLAHGPEELREKILTVEQFEQFTSLTITDPQRIRDELAAIKKRGFAVNRGERELEVAAIAAPIFNHDSKVECALAVVGPVQRFSLNNEEEIVTKLLEATRRISQALGSPAETRGKE
jgi:DNA-binding IclR family transcriptional regulator